MLQRMSIGKWFKNLFSGSSAPTDASRNEIDINEARIAAGGGGGATGFGVTGHESPGERTAEDEGFSSHS